MQKAISAYGSNYLSPGFGGYSSSRTRPIELLCFHINSKYTRFIKQNYNRDYAHPCTNELSISKYRFILVLVTDQDKVCVNLKIYLIGTDIG